MNKSETPEGREEKKVLTIWQKMEEEGRERLNRYTPDQLKEMEELWKASSTEEETDTESDYQTNF